jgi:hypothetical protein
MIFAFVLSGALAYSGLENGRDRFRLGESVSFGIKGGLSVSHFRGDGVDVLDDQIRQAFTELSDDPLPFFTAGIFATLALTENFALQPEVIYQRNGKQFEGTVGGKTYDFELHIDYLSFPFLVKIMAPSPDMLFRPNLFAGPVLNIALDAKAEGVPKIPAEVEDLGFLEQFRDEEDIGDHTRAADFALALGAGIDAKAGPGHFTFEIRYTTGFADVFNDDRNAEEFKNAAVSIFAGYAYDF